MDEFSQNDGFLYIGLIQKKFSHEMFFLDTWIHWEDAGWLLESWNSVFEIEHRIRQASRTTFVVDFDTKEREQERQK